MPAYDTGAARRSVLRRSGHFRCRQRRAPHCHYVTRGCHLVFQASVFLTARIEGLMIVIIHGSPRRRRTGVFLTRACAYVCVYATSPSKNAADRSRDCNEKSFCELATHLTLSRSLKDTSARASGPEEAEGLIGPSKKELRRAIHQGFLPSTRERHGEFIPVHNASPSVCSRGERKNGAQLGRRRRRRSKSKRRVSLERVFTSEPGNYSKRDK